MRVNNPIDRQLRGITDANGRFDLTVRIPPYLGTFLLAANANRTRQGMIPRLALSQEAEANAAYSAPPEAGARGGRSRSRSRRQASVGRLHRLPHADEPGRRRTDADGRWTVRVPADTKEWLVFARKAKVGFDYAVAGERTDQQALVPLPEQLTLTLDGAKPRGSRRWIGMASRSPG